MLLFFFLMVIIFEISVPPHPLLYCHLSKPIVVWINVIYPNQTPQKEEIANTIVNLIHLFLEDIFFQKKVDICLRCQPVSQEL